MTEREWNKFRKLIIEGFSEYAGVTKRHARQIFDDCRDELEGKGDYAPKDDDDANG